MRLALEAAEIREETGMPEMAPVASSNLAAVGYRLRTLTLYIQFSRGDVYQYVGVTPDVYDGLMTSPSPGIYFRN
jgi:hypothetical protein